MRPRPLRYGNDMDDKTTPVEAALTWAIQKVRRTGGARAGGFLGAGTVLAQLDTYATELCREAEISGRVGSETSRRAAVLTEQTGLSPRISWSKTGTIQLNQEITVTLTLERNIGLFGGFGSFPITLRSEASGKSEVYHK